jgi:hypothetical protein
MSPTGSFGAFQAQSAISGVMEGTFEPFPNRIG